MVLFDLQTRFSEGGNVFKLRHDPRTKNFYKKDGQQQCAHDHCDEEQFVRSIIRCGRNMIRNHHTGRAKQGKTEKSTWLIFLFGIS
ncbi:MAG: hypothetical protein ACI4I5_10610 [Acutalibacteraceae bacterium]